MRVLSCAWHPAYLHALSGLTGCLRPQAVRRSWWQCVPSAGDSIQAPGAVAGGIFDSIMSCCPLLSCEAARCRDRGALCAAQASRGGLTEPGWKHHRANIFWMLLSVSCIFCLSVCLCVSCISVATPHVGFTSNLNCEISEIIPQFVLNYYMWILSYFGQGWQFPPVYTLSELTGSFVHSDSERTNI